MPEKPPGKTHLHFNIQNARPALLCHVLDGLHAGSVQVAAELRPLDESPLVPQFLKSLAAHEVVLDAITLCAARRTCRVGDGETESIRVLLEQAVGEGRFACAGRSRDDDWLCAFGRVWCRKVDSLASGTASQ